MDQQQLGPLRSLQAQRHQQNRCGRGQHRRGTLHQNAQRAVRRIVVRIERVRMRHLHQHQQSHQKQAQNRQRAKAALLLAVVHTESGKQDGLLLPEYTYRRSSPGPGRGFSAFCATSSPHFRLHCWTMRRLSQFRTLCVAMLFAAPALCFGQSSGNTSQQTGQHGRPLVLKPDLNGLATNHRLILKDGSFQSVRRYEVKGDRVRYLSNERGGDWEELPADLVDWKATRKWERDHANQAAEEPSAAMKEAAEIDKEEAEERKAEQNRHPEVAPGLDLPDEDTVFVLDTFQGTPELVELQPHELNMNQKTHHGLGTLNPMIAARATLELEGSSSRLFLHVNEPAIYLSLNARDDKETVLSHAVTVDTSSAKDVANRKHGAHSPQSGFALVRLDQRRAVRVVGAIHVSPLGKVTQSEDVIPAKTEALYDNHWLRLTPTEPLTVGEYALVEILGPEEMNSVVWDFRVDPRQPDNPGALTPIHREKQ